MTKSIILTIGASLLCSCVHAIDKSKNVSPQNLPNDYFSENVTCTNFWGEKYYEWKKNGGGLKSSITETKSQIAADEKSELANMIKYSWVKQKIPRDEKLWHWPLSQSEWISLQSSIDFDKIHNPPAECNFIGWLDSIVWEDIYKNKIAKPKEAPNNMSWESPFAQRWVLYWILKKTD